MIKLHPNISYQGELIINPHQFISVILIENDEVFKVSAESASTVDTMHYVRLQVVRSTNKQKIEDFNLNAQTTDYREIPSFDLPLAPINAC